MIRKLALLFAIVVVSSSIGMPPYSVTTASAKPSSPPTEAEVKKEWQDRYQRLLREAARLAQNAAASRENYARAQRRNYPRGGARDQFIIDAQNAEKELVKVKAEIDGIFDEARHASIPPNWLYEVEDDHASYTPPASAPATVEADQAEDREGRNPLYFKDDDDGK